MDINVEKPIVAVLLGDAAGIGSELIAKLAAEGYLQERCRPIIIGDKRILERGMKIAGVTFAYHLIADPAKPDFSRPINLFDAGGLDPAEIKLGELNSQSGKAMGATLLAAVDLYRKGVINGILFAPLNKAAMKLGGFNFESEHSLVGNHLGVTTPYGEVNVLNNLITSRVTSHIPIKDVSAHITKQSVLNAIHLLNDTVRKTGNPSPRLAVAALNPHSGENGTCGREEIDSIGPAIEAARAEGVDAIGPVSADVLFFRAFRGDFHAAVTMYHDQGQIALKTKGFEHGVTVFGGIPVPITTPAHGTAFDIAGKNLAHTTATKNALDVVVNMGIYDMRHRK